MTFDRKEYQREYMKEYMRKRRAPSDMCQDCEILNKCNGPAKSVVYRCRLEPVTSQTEKEEDIQGRARREGVQPIFIHNDTMGFINKIREITGDDVELIINRLAYADLKNLKQRRKK